MTTEGLAWVREVAAAERWLAVLVTLRPSESAHARADPSVSVVNAGVLPHPLTGEPVQDTHNPPWASRVTSRSVTPFEVPIPASTVRWIWSRCL